MQTLSLPSSLQFQTVAKPKTAGNKVNMQRMGTRCWQRLVDQGVPFQDARELAVAIIHYIYLNNSPSQAQKHLIGQYHQHICAANLSSLQF